MPKNLMEETPYLNHVLTRLFVVAHHPKLRRYKWSWIDISRRANVDPGRLITENISEFMNAVAVKSWPTEKVFPS
jgi:Generalcontrol nonderepressible 1 (Gcn1) N-terminal